tara:strand:- start:245 stop:457 length:213 start_codon:yes stop_codon:yes gene_type:complete
MSYDNVTIKQVNLKGLNKKQRAFISKLNAATYLGERAQGSIMEYGEICDHDDGFLCEHRLQAIIDFLVEQ